MAVIDCTMPVGLPAIPGVKYRPLDEIVGIKGYWVGSDGTLWSERRRGGTTGVAKRMKPWERNKYGHQHTRFGGKYFQVHRLVLFAFVGKPPEGHECRHLDGNARNNDVSNLCWGTPQDNWDDRRKHGRDLDGIKAPAVKLTEQQVRDIRTKYRYRKRGYGFRCLAKEYGVAMNAIRCVIKRTTWKHIE
jgi:hypothetical protein